VDRVVEAEWLDALAPEDPSAVGSRRDLRWLNACMGNARIVARVLRDVFRERTPDALVELGAGDGWFLWRVLRGVGRMPDGTQVVLVDRQAVVTPELRRAFRDSGWRLHVTQADALDWLQHSDEQSRRAVMTNLFLHHFTVHQLVELFEAIARRADVLVAVDPRRSLGSLVSSRLVGMIGCNRVTRHDAPASVRAGFAGCELSGLWPAGKEWLLEERSAGLFSHLFVARRKVTKADGAARRDE
jgi:hypothetical protein